MPSPSSSSSSSSSPSVDHGAGSVECLLTALKAGQGNVVSSSSSRWRKPKSTCHTAATNPTLRPAAHTHLHMHVDRTDIHTYIHTYTHLVYREPWEALAWRNVGAHRCNMLLSRGRRWRQSFVVVGFGKDRKHRAMAKMEESMSVSLLMFKLLKSMPKLLKSMSVSLLMSKLSKSMSASLLMSKLLKSMPKPMSLLHASVSHPRSLSAMGSSSSSSTMASWPPKSWNGKGEYATIAGGCFWSVELMVTRIPGKREG